MRKLTEADRPGVLAYLMPEPEYNLFILGDVENFGFKEPFQELFAYEIDGKFDSLLLRYRDNAVLYSHHEKYETQPILDLLRTWEFNLNGKQSIIEKIAPSLPDMTISSTYLSKLTHINEPTRKCTGDVHIERLNPAHAEQMLKLTLSDAHFAAPYIGKEKEGIEKMRLNFLSGGRSFGVFSQGELISTASSAAENSMSAMIVGVITRPDMQRKGLADLLVRHICEQCFKDGKQFICLFYDNPAAGRIYRRIGFEEMGRYMMLQTNNAIENGV